MRHHPALPLTLWLVIIPLVSAYDPPARWGQAVVRMQNGLFVHGGKVDQLNQFSYTAAPNVNDLLYLPLSKPFPIGSPPWELLNSTTQGPSISWHTISAFNATHALLFGGLPGPNSQTVLLDAPDSAELINLSSPTNPQWQPQLSSWAAQPNRRIRHTSSTAPSGSVYIFGGEKADGSQNALAEYFQYVPNVPTFTAVSAPPESPLDVYGHATVVLPGGRIIMLGGYSQSEGTSIPLSTLRILDTKQSNPTWSTVTTATTLVPAPRIAFAATVLLGRRILIHGGSDFNLQVNMEDGWVLDTETNPMTWSKVDALSQIGGRRDHFAVAVGNFTIFGFGYANNGPAPATLQIFDFGSNSYVDTFTPPSPNIPVTPTLPTGSIPTPTNPPGANDGGSNDPNDPNPGVKDPTKPSAKAVAAIVLGVVFGLVALVVVIGSVAYYRRRQHQAALAKKRRHFFTLDGDEDDNESQHLGGIIPEAAMNNPAPTNSRFTNEHGFLSSLGIAGALTMASKLKRAKTHYERRDMLADEDSQSLGHWFLYNERGKDGTAGSSWSLKSLFGGDGKKKSRDTSSVSGYDMRDIRGEGSNPFADSAAVLARTEQTAFISGTDLGINSSYHDPFADPIDEIDHESLTSKPSSDSHVPIYGNMGPTIRHISPVSLLHPLHTALPLTGYTGQPAAASTNGSQTSLAITPQTYTSRTSHSDNDLSRMNDSALSHKTSDTSFDISRSPPGSPLLTGSAILGSTLPSHPIKRSDTWWARFSRSNLLDRRSSDASRKNFDIRDPQPPPRLGPIEELSLRDSASPIQHTPEGSNPDSTLSDSSTNRRPKIGSMYPRPPKSMSSLRTANTEQIEYMAGTMDVVQRIKSSSRHGTDSYGSAGGMSVESSNTGFDAYTNEYGENSVLFDSPVDESATPTFSYAPHLPPLPFTMPPDGPRTTSPPPRGGATSPPVASSGGVASRIQAYERRMSVDHGKEDNKNRTKMDYGLVPRASLFVANPDHRLSTSSS